MGGSLRNLGSQVELSAGGVMGTTLMGRVCLPVNLKRGQGESQGFSPNPRAMVSRPQRMLAPALVLRMPPSLPPTVAQINQTLEILFS